jgi:hypothetical protein
VNNDSNRDNLSNSVFASRNKTVLIVFSIIGGYFLLTEHLAHVIQVLPYLLIFVCVGIHFFMRIGHSHSARKHDLSDTQLHSQGKM